jgi:putative glutamine amidotransferase
LNKKITFGFQTEKIVISMIKKTIFVPVALIFAFAFLTGSCTRQDGKTKIALSYVYGEKTTNSYIKWLKNINPDAEYLVMYDLPKDSVEIVFKECSALLLTGGEDVYPERYGKEYDTVRCGKFDLYRDSLEFKLIELALKEKMPILGVCRGQQILNVALGGTLYVDIPTDINSMVRHRCKDWKNCFHQVRVLPNNLLSQMSGLKKGKVNSNHHQAIDRLARDFRVFAITNDGIIESIGWKDTIDKPFFMAVQWHPERMDTASMLSKPIARKFLDAADKFRN